MTAEDRIEALERAFTQLAEHTVAQAAATVAQGVIARAVVELIGRAGVSLDDVRDHAIAMAAEMSGDVGAAVRTILAEAPAGLGRVQ